MEYTIVHRDPQAFQQAVSLEHMKAMCERAFGQGTPVDSVRELDGGQFNNTYLIGLVPYGSQFPTWSLTLIDWLESTINDAESSSLDTVLLCRLLELVRDNTAFLDEITCPRLLHGDLWLFNLLIQRTKDGPRIVGVLDADRGSWGDPLADWTFFLLSRRASPQEQALFWQEYGLPEAGPGALFRAQIYKGLHQGKILSIARRVGTDRGANR